VPAAKTLKSCPAIVGQMNKFKVIRDSIHGDIQLSRAEMEVIDSLAFQRLRRIKQLGVTNLVYPGANHTRFEHSLGALYLASRISRHLKLKEEDEKSLRIAALLHDIGHGPLSHTSEELLDMHANCSHEDMAVEIIKSRELGDIIESHDISPETVLSLLTKNRRKKKTLPLSCLISGDVDVDRMDYLVRDAYYTGVGYGIVDLDRLVNTIRIDENEVIIEEGGIKAAEGLLVARFLMTPTVYLHKTSRIADAMFLRAMGRAIEEKKLKIKELHKMDDYHIQAMFRSSSGYIKDIGERFDSRRLFKSVKTFGWNELTGEIREKVMKIKKDLHRWRKIEKELEEECGIREGYLILDISPISLKTEINIKVSENEKKTKLAKLSPLVKILQEYYKAQWNVAIYTEEKYVKRVEKRVGDISRYL